jgi:bacillithiol biosynthesis cysteine-adding enzyme BshC
MTQTAAPRLIDQRVPYEQTPVGNRLLAWLGRDEAPDGFPLLRRDEPADPPPPPHLDRDALADALASYNASVGNALPRETIDALRGRGRLIITGQQPGLLLGPAYTLLKAITAIRLAADLSRPDAPVLPAFWIASEDHDIAEVNHAAIGAKRFTVRHELLSRGGRRPPAGWLSLKPWHDQILAFVDDALPPTVHRRRVSRLVAGCDFSDYASFFATLMARMLGPGRVVLVDPMRLRRELAPALAAVVERAGAMSAAFDAGSEMLRDHGFEPQLERMGLFQFVDGKRVPAELSPDLAGRIRADSERYSPGAALRPLVQDAALPVRATVGGPAEMLYLWQIDPLYRAAGVERSRLMPRLSATLMDREHRAHAEPFGLTGAALFGARQMLRDFDPAAYEDDSPDLREIERQRDALIDRIEQLDLEGQVQRAKRAVGSIRYQVDQLAAQIRHQRLSRQGRGKDRLGQLAAWLLPDGKPQERVISPVDWIGRYGPELVDALVETLDPWPIAHRIIDVQTPQEEQASE